MNIFYLHLAHPPDLLLLALCLRHCLGEHEDAEGDGEGQ